MLVRVADSSDTRGIEVLLGRSYPVLMRQAYLSDVLALALPSMARAKPELLASGSFYVAEKAGGIVGCGGWTFAAPGSGDIIDGLVHARQFAVDPDCAGTGVGRAIFDRSAKDAVAAGASRIQAFSSLNAEPFYARMGLKRLGLVHVPMGEGVSFPVVLMEGQLSAS